MTNSPECEQRVISLLLLRYRDGKLTTDQVTEGITAITGLSLSRDRIDTGVTPTLRRLKAHTINLDRATLRIRQEWYINGEGM